MTPVQKLLLTLILALGLNGCGTTPSSNYYMLSASSETLPSSNSQKNINVGLGPIDFPAYLDRNKIVVITGNNSLRTAEYHRWAEPLESNFARVLAEDLAAAVPDAEVYSFPWRPGNGIDIQIYIKVLRFDTSSDNISRLDVRWELTDKHGGIVYPAQSRKYSVPSRNGDYPARVEALSDCVSAFSRDLAENIREAGNSVAP